MQYFNLETHIGADGILHLELPVLLKNTDLKVTVMCRPSPPSPAKQENPSLWQALQAFRANTDLDTLDIDTGIFDRDRKQETEREVEL